MTCHTYYRLYWIIIQFMFFDLLMSPLSNCLWKKTHMRFAKRLFKKLYDKLILIQNVLMIIIIIIIIMILEMINSIDRNCQKWLWNIVRFRKKLRNFSMKYFLWLSKISKKFIHILLMLRTVMFDWTFLSIYIKSVLNLFKY
jgi:hypothetical protein